MQDLIAAEWLKTRTLRSTWWTLALTVAVVVGSAALAARANYLDFPAMSPAEQREHGFALSAAFPLGGYLVLIVAATGFGASLMAGEYASGLIRVTTVAVPARSEALLAKAVVAAAVWTVAGAVAAGASFAVSQGILAVRGADVALTDPGAVPAILGATLVGPVCALVGLGLATLIRHVGVVHVTGVLLLVAVPQLVRADDGLVRDVNHAMILPAWQRLTWAYGPPEHLGEHYVSGAGAWLAYAIWPLIVMTAALIVHARRDV